MAFNTNRLDYESFTADEMLKKYKEQQNVERGFAFLKDPLFCADRCVTLSLTHPTGLTQLK